MCVSLFISIYILKHAVINKIKYPLALSYPHLCDKLITRLRGYNVTI